VSGSIPVLIRASPGRGRLSVWVAVLVLLCGLFAPLLANHVPLVARVAGTWSFPAFADLVGPAPVGPGDLSWKAWRRQLPPGGADFAWMPPWPYGPTEVDPERFGKGPSLAHPLGSDDTGRDVLARLLHGAGPVVQLGLPSVALGALLGTLLGAWAGLRRGWAEFVVLRAIELFLCFPTLLFLMFVAAFVGSSSVGLMVVLAALFWTSFARIVRGELLSLREREFVLVARGLGVAEWRILWRHLLPLLRGRLGVTAAFCMAAVVVAESTLSFLGLGPGIETSSWGTMLRQGSEHAVLGGWHLWLVPAMAIVAVLLACHGLADRFAAAGRLSGASPTPLAQSSSRNEDG
jgi:peptide/nickel transport system permease protein